MTWILQVRSDLAAEVRATSALFAKTMHGIERLPKSKYSVWALQDAYSKVDVGDRGNAYVGTFLR